MRVARTRAAVLGMIGAALAGCTSTPVAPSSLAAGHQLAVSKCAGCHAVEAAGSSPHPQAPPFRDLYKRYPVEGLRRAFIEGIQVAHPMPRFRLQREDIDHLLEYLNSLNPCARRSSDRAAMERCFGPL